MKKIPCLWWALDEIDGALAALTNTPDEIREIGLEELVELVHFQDELESTARLLKNRLHAAAAGEVFKESRTGRRIASFNHPVLVALRKKAKSFRELASKIVHTNLRIN
jgi:hypothetical protein